MTSGSIVSLEQVSRVDGFAEAIFRKVDYETRVTQPTRVIDGPCGRGSPESDGPCAPGAPLLPGGGRLLGGLLGQATGGA